MKQFLTISAPLLLAVTNASAAAQPSHFEVLRDKYEHQTNSSITEQMIEGNYLGRCYQEGNDTPIGMVLATRKSVKTVDADSGPDFPSRNVATWQMGLFLKGFEDKALDIFLPDPASSNDDLTAADIADSFNYYFGPAPDANGVYAAGNGILSVSNGVASATVSSDDVHLKDDVRVGNDGLFYSHHTGHFEHAGILHKDNEDQELYCYFYQKLN